MLGLPAEKNVAYFRSHYFLIVHYQQDNHQVLVTDDLIGLNNTNIKFVKKFVNIKKYINLGFKKFTIEVKSKKYPSKKHSY